METPLGGEDPRGVGPASGGLYSSPSQARMPFLGMGAAMAIEDGMILARALAAAHAHPHPLHPGPAHEIQAPLLLHHETSHGSNHQHANESDHRPTPW